MVRSKVMLSILLLGISIGVCGAKSTGVYSATSDVIYAESTNSNERIVSTDIIRVKKYFWTDKSVEGKVFGDSYRTVGLIVDGELKNSSSVDANGNFKISTAGLGLTSANKSFEVVGLYDNGDFGERIVCSVSPKLSGDYKMTSSSYGLGEDSVYGTNEAGIDSIALRVNGRVVRRVVPTIDENGQETYSIYARDRVSKKSDKVEIVGYDSSGNTRTILNVKVNG